MSSSALGDYLKKLRLSQSLSKSEMAKFSDVSQPYMSQIESGGRIPTPDILEKISENLTKNLNYNVSFATLLEKSGYEKLAKGQHLLEIKESNIPVIRSYITKNPISESSLNNYNDSQEKIFFETARILPSGSADIIVAQKKEIYVFEDGKKVEVELNEKNLYNLKRILIQEEKPVSWGNPRSESIILSKKEKRILFKVLEAIIEGNLNKT